MAEFSLNNDTADSAINTSETSSQDIGATASVDLDTYEGSYFSIGYPTDDPMYGSSYDYLTEYASNGTVSVSVYSDKFIRYGSGTPATVEVSTAVKAWYDQQGTEYATDDNGYTVGSLETGAYSYKLTRYRGQANSAVVYVYDNNRDYLYEITIQESDDAYLVDISEDDSAYYEFSPEIQAILASFKIK